MSSIIHINSLPFDSSIGGVQTILQDLVEEQENFFENIFIITFEKNDTIPIGKIQVVKKGKVSIFSINVSHKILATNLNAIKNTDAKKSLVLLIKSLKDKYQANTVHIHDINFFGISYIHELKALGGKVFYSFHSLLLFCPEAMMHKNGKLCNINNKQCFSCSPHYQQNGLNSFEKRKEQVLDFFHAVDGIIFPRKFIRNKLIKWGINKEKMLLVENSISYEKYGQVKKKTTPSNDILTFGMIGRCVPEKGWEVMLKVIEKLNEAYENNTRYIFVIAKAEYPGKYTENLLKKISETKNIKCFFDLGQKEIKEKFYSQIQVLFIPSLVPEIGPLLINEASYFQIPIVGHSIGGIKESINKHNGWLYKNEDELYNLLKSIVEKPKQISEKKVKKLDDIGIYNKKLMHFYDKE